MMKTILGIDPGTKYLGVAVLKDRQLIASGVHTLRNGDRPYDVVGQARKVLLRAIARYRPEIIAIEKPLRPWTKRAALLTVIVEELRARSKELGIQVALLAPDQARRVVVGDPRATKVKVAHALVAQGFRELADRVPRIPKRAALGIAPRDRYWLHVFDALAVAVAATHTVSQAALRPLIANTAAVSAPRD
jgi:RNase H-fold protein (predicted Holliday junction resolvase)